MRPAARSRLKIGISACFFHPDEARQIFTGKTLQYMEQAIAHWVMSSGALAVMIPNTAGNTQRGDATLDDYAQWLDGLVLEGGADVSPASYGEVPLDPRWHGDAIRDAYEQDLLRAFESLGKPVMGVCRGLQLMNVAHGGTLWQDIESQCGGVVRHRDPAVGDRNLHALEFVSGSHLAAVYGAELGTVCSVHHQAIKSLAPGFVVEAVSPVDGAIEAIRKPVGSFMAAVQWHPEYHRRDGLTLDDGPWLDEFLSAADATRR